MSLLFMNRETREGFGHWLTFLHQTGQFKAHEELERIMRTYSHPDSPDLMLCARGNYIVPINLTEYVRVAEKGMNHRRARVSEYEWHVHSRRVTREVRIPEEFSVLFGSCSRDGEDGWAFRDWSGHRGYHTCFKWNMNGGLINHCGGDPMKSSWSIHT